MYFSMTNLSNERNDILLSNEDKTIKTNSIDWDGCKRTWEFSSLCAGNGVEFGEILCGGKRIDQVCPEKYITELKMVNDKMKCFVKAFSTSKVHFDNENIFSFLPFSFLNEFFSIRNKITKEVFETYERPKNYDVILELFKLNSFIKRNKLNFDTRKILSISSFDDKVRSLWKKVLSGKDKINYNIFGSITGRFSTKPDSFPILNLAKEYREFIIPRNHFFLELDFNAIDLRSLIHLNGKVQPKEDIHDWNRDIYNEETGSFVTRDEIKKKVLTWLYSTDTNKFPVRSINDVYDKNFLAEKYWKNGKITNSFDREIECDKQHAIPLLGQSESADLFARQALALHKVLNNTKSHLTALIHDSCLIDLHEDDKVLIDDFTKVFGDTKFGKTKVNVKMGTTFGEMKAINENK